MTWAYDLSEICTCVFTLHNRLPHGGKYEPTAAQLQLALSVRAPVAEMAILAGSVKPSRPFLSLSSRQRGSPLPPAEL